MRPRPGPTDTRRIAAAWLPALGWAFLIWWLGSGDFAAPTTSRILEPLLRWLLPDLPPADRLALAAAIRKLAHPTVYGVFAALAFRAALRSELSRLGATALALALAFALATLDELRQAGLASRTGAAGDVALDVTGAAAALGGALLWTHRRSRPSRRREGDPDA